MIQVAARERGCSGAAVTPTPINLYFPSHTDRSFDIHNPRTHGGARNPSYPLLARSSPSEKAWAGSELPLRERPTEGGEWRGPPNSQQRYPRIIFPKKQKTLEYLAPSLAWALSSALVISSKKTKSCFSKGKKESAESGGPIKMTRCILIGCHHQIVLHQSGTLFKLFPLARQFIPTSQC